MNGAPVIHSQKQIFEAGAMFLTLPDKFVGTLPKSATTVSVKNLEVFKFINTTPVTVTNLLDAQSGQTVRLLGDGQTTLEHGTSIYNNTGADKLLAANLIYVYTNIGGVWYEDAP